MNGLCCYSQRSAHRIDLRREAAGKITGEHDNTQEEHRRAEDKLVTLWRSFRQTAG
jgi:hypothetical protein